jgi:hypothetical protein
MQATTTTPARTITVGRVVEFFAGYSGQNGLGAIVAVHGTPSGAARDTSSLVRVMRPDDCTFDVILFDGRRFLAINECGVDRPGIGFKLQDNVIIAEELADLPEIAAARETAEAIAAAKARADFEAAEAARVIVDVPLFYYNGIKDAKGGKLQKCWYSSGELRSYPAGTITIYARDYCRFSDKVNACFAVQNDTDTMTDYFDSDRIRVLPSHPLYPAVCAAMASQEKRRNHN